MRFLVVYNGPDSPDRGSSGTVWQTNRALERLGHKVSCIYQDDLKRSLPHHNLHYAFELPRRILEAVQTRAAKSEFDVILISQPYGYLVGKWLRASESRTLYLHRSHGHELAVSNQLASWGDALGAKRNLGRRVASRLLALRLHQQARLALKYADGTVVPSTFDRDFLIDHEGANSQTVRAIFHASVPAYLDSNPQPYTEDRHKKLLYVGNFTRVKGGDILWETGTTLLRKYPDLSLTVVTDPSDQSKARSGFGADVIDRVSIQNWVSQNELMSIYDRHGLQIVPSRYEGASKAHYEGMSRGLCLICSSVGAMRDTITNGQDGFLVSAGDSDGFVAATSRVVADFDLAASMSSKARTRALDFRWELTANGIVEFAGELLSERATRDRKEFSREYAISRN
jgi:glycosyltransferase involved in cell wall biosynthesis